MKKLRIAAILLAIFLLLTGCTKDKDVVTADKGETKQTAVVETESTAVSAKNETGEPVSEETTDEPKSETTDEPTQEVTEPVEEETEEPQQEFDFNIPADNGNAYAEVNGNKPFFPEEDKKRTDAFENYSSLDSLGRCGVAYANVCRELQPTEPRGEIGMIKPSGWKTVKYNGVVDGNYLYNRCHLIGFQLAGENANERNLITGTRYMNVQGMLPFENEIDDYLEKYNHHVLYRVTPVFEGDNLVAAGVLMEAWSVEDNGKGICFNVFCFNKQPNVEIDYATGESRLTGEAEPETERPTAEPETETERTAENQIAIEYILNTNTGKFHLSGCSGVKRMSEKNKKTYTGTFDEIINMGYDPCGICLK